MRTLGSQQKRGERWLVQSLLCLALLTIPVALSAGHSQTAGAVQNWNAGRIIDDYVFTNTNTMNPEQIQAFLNSKVPTCDTYGARTSEFGGGTRRQWAEARGYYPPYTCLKDFNENGRSAAQIIYDTAQEFRINPQVLIVLLQKEQSLVTDTWPLNIQYRSATGYGCPDGDGAVCDAQYYGYTAQLRWAARMFRAILNNTPTWYTPYTLGNNYIRWSPNSACGGSVVNIENRATQALYNYTPYQPNQAALNANYGSGDSCSSHGNRNFYLYFNDWFGPTLSPSYAWRQIDKVIYTDDSKSSTLHESQISRNQRFYVQIKALNTGNATWRKGSTNQQVNVGTWQKMDRDSSFCNPDWLGGCNRAATTIEDVVAPGEVGTFEFWMTAPSQVGTYNEFFNLVMDGTSWLQDIGFYWRFTVNDDAPGSLDSIEVTGKRSLYRGDVLVSPNGQNALIFEDNGALQISNKFVHAWEAPSRLGVHLVLQNDGNLVLYDSQGLAVWASGTTTARKLVLQNDGNLVLYDSQGLAVWASGTAANNDPLFSIRPGQIAHRGQYLVSSNGKYTLALQKDGNIVIYASGRPIWATSTTDAKILTQQIDGNLVAYNKQGRAVWASNSSGQDTATYLQIDGNLVTYSPTSAIWAAGSWQRS